MAEKLVLKSKVTKVCDFKSIEYKDRLPKFKADFNKVEADIKKLRYANGIHKKVDEVKNGDFVKITTESKLPQFNKKGIFLYVGRKLYNERLEELLIGMNKNEKRTFSINNEDVTVTIEDIERISIPTLEDAVVASWNMEGVKTIDELKKYLITRQVEAFREEDEDADIFISTLVKESIDNSEFELDPEETELVDKAIKKRLSELKTILEDQDQEEVILDTDKLISSMLLANLKAAVVAQKMLAEDDELLDEDDYEHELGSRAMLMNITEEEARASYSKFEYVTDAYGMYYFDLIDEYVGEIMKKEYVVLEKEDPRYDVAIIGAGPAGMSAALTLKLHNKKILWFGTPALSDKVGKSEKIANYPGVGMVSGAELNKKFMEQIEGMDLTLTDKMVTQITSMSKGKYFMLLADNEIFEARTVLLAAGLAPAKGYENEEALLGHGVSYCATCDGFLYKNKPIAVYCGAKRYEHEVEYLADMASNVKLIAGYPDCSINLPNVELVKGPIKSIIGEERVEGVELKDGTRLEVQGVFILRTAVAPTSLLSGLEMDGPHIAVDRRTKTNIPGVFAAGDCTGRPYQITKATGEGNVAAHEIVEYLSNN